MYRHRVTNGALVGTSSLATVSWSLPPTNAFTLAGDDVHVWGVSVSESIAGVAALQGILSDDERTRAQRYRFAVDRDRYYVSRGLLRRILARYLGIAPAAVAFSYGARGKPCLAIEPVAGPIYFNVSHSADLVLYAFTAQSSAIGIDVEYVQPLTDMSQIAARFFSPAERRELDQLNQDQQRLGFFNCWTRKEAYIKAIGDGLAHGLDNFDVSLTPGVAARLLAIRAGMDEASRWILTALTPSENYVAALAICATTMKLHRWRVPPVER